MREAGALLVVLALLAVPLPAAQAATLELSEPVVLRAAAVAETDEGLVGTTATITVSAARGGSGHIFLDTFPLAEVDMQGSARLAVRVASHVTGVPWQEHDFFFVVRSNSPVIGGPSAGATLTVGAIAALAGWTVRSDVLMTGTISPDGSIGPVGGVPQKAAAARLVGLSTFLFPAAQELVNVNGENLTMQQYCTRDLGITCTPVHDVIDAVNVMTDHRIERPAVPENVTNEFYRSVLGPLSGELLAGAAALVAEADAAVAALDDAEQAQWAPRLAAAHALLDSAEAARANGTHYTAASLSFQTSIEGHTIRDSARLMAADDPASMLTTILAESRADVSAARDAVVAARVTHASNFETVGAAQVRLHEAEARMARAETLAAGSAEPGAAFVAVYEGAYASERAQTATWWLGLSEHAPPGPAVSDAQLHEAAGEAITLAKEAVAYIDAVLRESAGPGAQSGASARIAEAQTMLDRGFAAGAILQAFEAEVRAASFLDVATYGGVVPEAKFESARLAAARAITEARARGVEPLLAQSQYEFGLTLENPLERLAFLGLARVTANLAGLPNVLDASPAPAGETRFQGLARPPGVPPPWIIAAFAVGLSLGVGAGLTALMPREEARRRVEETEN